MGFCQATARMASLKLRVSGGKAVLVSAYAPHSGYNFAERQSFYHDLSEFAAKLSSHGPKIIFGDFNARLYRRMPGEEHIIGPNVFNNAEAIVKDDMNRHLLIELCTSLDTVVANTFFETPDTEQVTCYNVGSKPKDAVQWKSHSQIDFVIVPRAWVHTIEDVRSDMSQALASHHFLLVTKLRLHMPKSVDARSPKRPQVSALRETSCANRFAILFDASMENASTECDADINLMYARILDSFGTAADTVLSKQKLQARRPWISNATLVLLESRQDARHTADFEFGKSLAKEIKASVARDRGIWLDGLLATGDWS